MQLFLFNAFSNLEQVSHPMVTVSLTLLCRSLKESKDEMRNLWLTSSILSTASGIQPLANEAKKSLLQAAGFSLLPLQNLCRGECPYVPLSLSQIALQDDVRSLIISEVPHNDMIHEMMECLLKALGTG